MLIVFRKFMIAFASLMYRRTPSYQLATALLVLFIAFGLQVRHTPYLSHGDHHEVLASMKQKEAVSASHRALVSTINAAIAHSAARTSKSSSWRGVSLSRDAMRQNVVVAAKLLSDYNIVESVLLASAVMVALAGVMFASGRFEQEAAESQSGYLAAATAGLIILTIIYFCAVLVVDASPQCAGILARCAPRLFLTKREVARAGDTAGADARGQGGGPVEMAVMENPLVSRAAAAASKNTTPDGTGGGGATAAIAVLQVRDCTDLCHWIAATFCALILRWDVVAGRGFASAWSYSSHAVPTGCGSHSCEIDEDRVCAATCARGVMAIAQATADSFDSFVELFVSCFVSRFWLD